MSFDKNKLLSRLFRRVGNVVLDATTGQVGIKSDAGVTTFAMDGDTPTISVNPFDGLSFKLPAFAVQKPVSAVKAGDLLVANDRILGWALNDSTADTKSINVLSADGHVRRYAPPKVAILNQQGVLVVQSLAGTGEGGAGVNPMLLAMLAGGEGEFDPMTFLALSGGLGGAAAGGDAAANPLGNPMLLAMMMGGGKKGGKLDPLTLMALTGGLGGAAPAGGNNLLTMLALTGGLGDDDTQEVSLNTRRPPLTRHR